MAPTAELPRLLRPRVQEALLDTPVVVLNGPRQAGKTTLARSFTSNSFRYLSLDDPATLLAARQDPAGLLRELDRVVIDEVQRAPEIMLALKQAVDNDRRPGRFLLTGSADLRTLPSVADSLAGRMEVLTLLPFAGCELEGSGGRWLDDVFSGRIPSLPAGVGNADLGPALVERVLQGGYPEVIARPTQRRRQAWLRQYVQALLSRDVRDIASVEKLEQLPRLLQALALMSGQLTNINQLAAQVGLDHKTTARYVGIFEQLFLLRRLQPWLGNRLSRLVKSPRLHLLDSGLLAHLQGVGTAQLEQNRSRFGPLLEGFVVSELFKLASWSELQPQLLFYRDKDQREVDVVLECPDGQLVGVEVKAKASLQRGDLNGLQRLADRAGDRLRSGVLLYDGLETLPLGPGLWAVPLATLWRL